MNEKPQGERWCTVPHDPWCPKCRRELSDLRAALALLVVAADRLLDAGNPQDWRPLDVAVNRARTLL